MYCKIKYFLFFSLFAISLICEGKGIEITKVRAGNNQDFSSFIEISLDTVNVPELGYNQNYLIFQFERDPLDRTSTVLYRLEGLDYTWIECVDCQQVQYAHLDGGEYNFMIKSDEEGAPISEFPFRIQGKVWHQWWFVPSFVLFFLGIGGIGFYFFALYRMRQEMRAQLLVHKEKLAAMVDLTAGVAHEIQNPLNFVNNFAELSSELIVEAEEEIENNDLDEVKEIIQYLKENLSKISNHGGRASNIIREMQEHAKPISTVKSPTDINTFCQAHLDVALYNYKESGIGVLPDVVTQFDEKLQKINIAQDEMKKVLLNILSNAFDAVSSKALATDGAVSSKALATDGARGKDGKADAHPPKGDSTRSHYKPLVSITTKSVGSSSFGGQEAAGVTITITDNGIGMSQETIDKVFQPFFTTKPAGQGTGLGMSISYDIVTKGHGGELKVESKEGEGTTFIIQLPSSI